MVVGFTPSSYRTQAQVIAGLTPTVTVTNTGTNGTGLALTATVTGDVISALTVTNPGSGYSSAPTIAISAGSGGTQATGTVYSYPEVLYRAGIALDEVCRG